jgi:hypothetical protein
MSDRHSQERRVGGYHGAVPPVEHPDPETDRRSDCCSDPSHADDREWEVSRVVIHS